VAISERACRPFRSNDATLKDYQQMRENGKGADIKLRRSYKRTSKQLVRDTYNGAHPKRRKKADAAKQKLRIIAGRLVWELERKLPEGMYVKELELYKKVLA